MPASGLRLRERALKALGRREHTRQELRVKLGGFAESVEQLDSLLDDLERRGWLSEARFVEQLTLRRRSRFGAARILWILERAEHLVLVWRYHLAARIGDLQW